MFSPCGNTSPPTILVIFHDFPVSFGVLTILRYLHQLFPGNPDPGTSPSRPSCYELMTHVSLLVCNSYFDFKIEAKPGVFYCIWWWALKWAMPAILVYASGVNTGPYVYCFSVDALANHFEFMGWGGGCINVRVDSKQKRLRWCQALTVGNILRDGFCVGTNVMWYVMGLGVGWGGGWGRMNLHVT